MPPFGDAEPPTTPVVQVDADCVWYSVVPLLTIGRSNRSVNREAFHMTEYRYVSVTQPMAYRRYPRPLRSVSMAAQPRRSTDLDRSEYFSPRIIRKNSSMVETVGIVVRDETKDPGAVNERCEIRRESDSQADPTPAFNVT